MSQPPKYVTPDPSIERYVVLEECGFFVGEHYYAKWERDGWAYIQSKTKPDHVWSIKYPDSMDGMMVWRPKGMRANI